MPWFSEAELEPFTQKHWRNPEAIRAMFMGVKAQSYKGATGWVTEVYLYTSIEPTLIIEWDHHYQKSFMRMDDCFYRTKEQNSVMFLISEDRLQGIM